MPRDDEEKAQQLIFVFDGAVEVSVGVGRLYLRMYDEQ
jgi:hypothetical protein